MIKEQSLGLVLQSWVQNLQRSNLEALLILYHPEGILLPTFSSRSFKGIQEIRTYFVNFLQKRPKPKIITNFPLAKANLGVISGLYDFHLLDGKVVHARYTFVFLWNGAKWEIMQHHSSLLPEY